MSINILRYSLFGIAGGQEVDHIFVKPGSVRKESSLTFLKQMDDDEKKIKKSYHVSITLETGSPA